LIATGSAISSLELGQIFAVRCDAEGLGSAGLDVLSASLFRNEFALVRYGLSLMNR
jgi:hypothetical protein